MGELLSAEFFKEAYREMEDDLQRRSKDNSLCAYCLRLDMPRIFKPTASQEDSGEIKRDHGSLSDLGARKDCPFCRLFWQLIRDGAGDSCCGDCHQRLSSPSTVVDSSVQLRIYPQPHRRVGAVSASLSDGQYLCYHIAHGDLHFVHPTQADHFRIREWINACETRHASCNEQAQTADGLFGHSKYSLRLIDIQCRRIVKSLRPVRYITLSYVWGNSVNRRPDMIENPSQQPSHFPSGIQPLDKQPVDLLFGRLGRTFEDLITFSNRLGERYIWIDALCIPQDEPDILAYQISKMDQVYFHSVCNVVSLSSGVDAGLPGASFATKRCTKQWVEQLPDESRIATPLTELYPYLPCVPWTTRGWTLQEHLLTRRSIFFGPHEVFLVCKEMSMKESWKRPRTAADIQDPDDRWYEYNVPLPSGKRLDRSALTDTLEAIVQMYTTRYLTFASDRHRAFQGLEARLVETYDIRFLHALPLSETHFPLSLLWSCLEFRDFDISSSTNPQWPSWSWLGHSAAVTYKPWNLWHRLDDFPTNDYLVLPKPEVHLQADGAYHTPGPDVPVPTPHTTVLRIRALALDITITQWHNRRSLPNAISLWDKKDFPTPRGVITFNLAVVADLPADNGNHGFPEGTETVRLVHISLLRGGKPKMPLLLLRGEPARRVPPSGTGETRLSRTLDWIEPDYSGKNNYLGAEPDMCLLIVGVGERPGAVVKRLGVAYVRVMDFLVAGAEVKEVLLG
ncbi:Heterokaryon incompatibility protein 6, OR allele [Madurella mycetomatis]|uniref:Heterokaryon incompatibility protein 6, OR allele n=1 Tax=Madurella mycetomatis TaxID=100816 RepID=A0A175WI78_9PEZI|nr:Heterokaryon incompatibility protein 6, OR allele [Madurella mycetomatis]